MENGLFLDVVIRECTAILEQLVGKHESLRIRGDSSVEASAHSSNLGLNILDGVRGLNIKKKTLARSFQCS